MIPVAKIPDKLLIAVALVATQPEVAMNSLDLIAQIKQNAQQSHTIGTAAERHKLQPLFRQKPILPDEIFNPAYQVIIISHSSFNIEHESLEVFALRMVDINRMVGGLMQLMEDAHLTASLSRRREDRIAEMVLRDHL